MRVAILGGGIAGLSAAYELARRGGSQIDYTLFEAASRLGGVISSQVVDGSVLEHGPDSFLTEKPAALELCRELGLESDLIPSNDSARKTFIVVRNKLIALPDGLMFLVPTKLVPTALTRLFSVGAKLRMAMEWFERPRSSVGDESVADLVRRHYGQEAVDRLADPLLSGIYGGEATQLSARSVLPRLVQMEAEFGSLTRGMLASRKKMQAERGRRTPSEAPRPVFTTLRGGLQQLIDNLVGQLDPARIRCSTAVESIARGPMGWRVSFSSTASGTAQSGQTVEDFDAVIVATPAWAAARLLAEAHPALSAELDKIQYSSSITMNLVYDEISLGPLPEGFGFLVPAVERRAILACTFVHRKFCGRTAHGKAVLRVFLGGARKEALLAESDQTLAAIVREELRQMLGITAQPERVEVSRWPRAMAQYAVGHADRLERIRAHVETLPGLRLVGNAYDGIGIADCIRLGRAAGRAVQE